MNPGECGAGTVKPVPVLSVGASVVATALSRKPSWHPWKLRRLLQRQPQGAPSLSPLPRLRELPPPPGPVSFHTFRGASPWVVQYLKMFPSHHEVTATWL